MPSIFDNYDNQDDTYYPDNRVRFVLWDNEYKDSITPGSTSTQVFELTLNYATEVKDIKIVYTQGVDFELTFGKDDVTAKVSDDGTRSYVYVVLSPTDTALFNDFNKDVKVQLQVTLDNDDIIYSRVYKIRMLKVVKATD